MFLFFKCCVVEGSSFCPPNTFSISSAFEAPLTHMVKEPDPQSPFTVTVSLVLPRKKRDGSFFVFSIFHFEFTSAWGRQLCLTVDLEGKTSCSNVEIKIER
jgi:hypothetical protein